TNYQPEGPYILLGWSAAGVLIFQVVRELEKRGREVSDIILIDSFFNREKKQRT
ncbi:thioesterase domain-containing protein, partial [Acidobacteriota bacterium]